MKYNINFTFALLFASISAFAQSPHAAQLYGLTQYGGAQHRGSIFHFTPETGNFTVDYEFQIMVTGKSPKSDLVAPGNGKYYGTTTAGGNHDAGLIFSWDSLTGEYLELYHLQPGDGANPRGAMQLLNNKYYGMTCKGGQYSYGVIFEYDFQSNQYIKKYDMDSINGMNPVGSLCWVGNVFIGFTNKGGSHNLGTIFEWNPATNVYTKSMTSIVFKAATRLASLKSSMAKHTP